jgi:hypothetical protein
MSDNKVKELLAKLHRELENTENVDSETLQMVRDLDEDIHRLVDSDAGVGDIDSVLDRANSVETRFAVDHPVAERFLREIMDALAKVGI